MIIDFLPLLIPAMQCHDRELLTVAVAEGLFFCKNIYIYENSVFRENGKGGRGGGGRDPCVYKAI